MPKLTGLDVTRRMRAHPATKEIPVILLTARVEEADIKQGLEAGATAYLKKHFSPKELQGAAPNDSRQPLARCHSEPGRDTDSRGAGR